MKLYIIGNGFDIAHGLETSYWHFRCYLEKNAERFLTDLEKLYGYYTFDPSDYHIPAEQQEGIIKEREDRLYNELWKNFETSLGNPHEWEIENICDSALDSLRTLDTFPYAIGDTLYVYYDEQFSFIKELQVHLLHWIEQIHVNNVKTKSNALVYNSEDLFLTFNYTPTLEEVYKIDASQICHIHGGIMPYCFIDPITGHGNKKAIEERRIKKQECDNSFDEGGASMNEALVDFYMRTFKDTDEALSINADFFEKLNGLDEIQAIGHSLGSVDMPYFEAVLEKAGGVIPWRVFYYSEKEKNEMRSSLENIGVHNIQMQKSAGFWDI